MQARRCYDVPAVRLHVESRAQLARAVADVAARMGKQNVLPSAARHRSCGLRQWQATLQFSQTLVPAVPRVHVEHHQAALAARDHPDICLGPLVPPDTELLGVGRGVLQPVLGARVLADAPTVTLVARAAPTRERCVQWDYGPAAVG